ncbi:MAG: PLP-dependent aminotransferase family protein [Aeromonadaceae bacterium]|nr:PLP-dependent aminotransferase family protein [Aeromonadaceae bacterium]MBP8064992.1 PLP-dependent aminotransferase family protein [Aeromonadaceae bacterium]MBP9568739.1 PLP-dependent aminotransferase family protein [Aeromonadaceae bacterium]
MFAQRIQFLTSSIIREILAAAQKPGVISFAGGLPAAASFPEVDWSTLPESFKQYGMSEGEPELREAIAAEARAKGLKCEASQVLVLSGSQQGLDLVAKLFIDPESSILVESPTYLAALQTFHLFQAQCQGVPLTADGLDLSVLERQICEHKPRLAYLIPSFQNPSGTCYSVKARQDVAAMLDHYGLPLIEDEPYCELDYDGVPKPPISSLLQRAPWVFQGSFSKILMPGLRVGYLIAHPSLMPHLVRLKQAADLHTNRPGQWLALEYMRSADKLERLARLQAFYRERRDAFAAALESEFADLADWQVPAGGLFFWLKLKQPRDTRPLLQPALAAGVAFMPGEAFFAEKEPPVGYLRLNFSHTEPELMVEGLRRLRKVLLAE